MKHLLVLLMACMAMHVGAQVPRDVAVPLKTFDPGEEFLHQNYLKIETNFLYIPTYDTTKKELKIHSYNHFSNTWSIIYTDTASRTIQYGKSGSIDFIIITSKADVYYDFIKILKIKGGNSIDDTYEPPLTNKISAFHYFIGKTQLYALADREELWQIDLQTDSIFMHDLPSPDGRRLKLQLSFGYRAIEDDHLIFTLYDRDDPWDFLVYGYEPVNGFKFISDRDTRFRLNRIDYTEKYIYIEESTSLTETVLYRTEKGKFDLQKMYDSGRVGYASGFQDYAFLHVPDEKTIYFMKDKLYTWSRFNGYTPFTDAFAPMGNDKMANIPNDARSLYIFDIKTGKIIATGAMKSRQQSIIPVPNREKIYILQTYSRNWGTCVQLNSDGSTWNIALGIQDRSSKEPIVPVYSNDEIYYIFKDKGQLRIVSIMETHARLDVKCFIDENSNGVVDGKETILEQSGVQLIDSQTDAVLEVDEGGIHLPKYSGNYTLNVKAPSFYGLTTTSTFNLHPDSIKSDTTLHVGLEKVKDTTLAELFINNHRLRCGFPGTSKSTITNTGSDDLRGVVRIKYHSGISVKSFNIQPDSSFDSIHYWTMPRVKPFEKWSVIAKLTWPSAEFRNQEITVDIDATLKSNQHYISAKENFSELMGCAYDPNDKAVTPDRPDHNGAILPGEALTYKIRFQNTGNDTAFNVRLVDTLSKHLNWETFRVLDQSHDMNTKLSKDGVVEFMFNNILLPDSNRDEPNSHGYVIYRIQPLKNLPVLSEITNKADIYFDYNPPITTNTTRSVYRDFLVSDKRPTVENELFSIYPNPTKDFVLFEFSNTHVAQVKVISSDGRVQLAQTIQSGEQLDLSNLQNGLYFLEAKIGGKTQMAKVLKQ